MRVQRIVIVVLVIVVLALACVVPMDLRGVDLGLFPPPSKSGELPHPPELVGSSGGLRIWRWSDARVECVIATLGGKMGLPGGIDMVCRSVAPSQDGAGAGGAQIQGHVY